jgi:HPt (histidine-containing phosphotransfer) domain-containing protein
MEEQGEGGGSAAGGAARPPSPEDDRVDEEILEELFSVLGGEVMDGLVRACDLFRTGLPARLDDIDTALAEGRLDQVSRLAHSVRGSTGAFGARHLSNLAARLEQTCGQGDGTGADALVTEMRAELVTFQAILDARLAAVTG